MNRRHSCTVALAGRLGVYALEKTLDLAHGLDRDQLNTVATGQYLYFMTRAYGHGLSDFFGDNNLVCRRPLPLT